MLTAHTCLTRSADTYGCQEREADTRGCLETEADTHTCLEREADTHTFLERRHGRCDDMPGRFTSRIVDGVSADVLKIVQSQVTVPDPSVYTIGDFGFEDCVFSMGLIRDVIALVRERSGARRPVQVLYEDQHSNDFNSLFRRLHGEIPDPPSYMHQFPDVFTMATATNFYRQCAPDNSMDLIFNFIAIHWLSKKPLTMKSSLFGFSDASPEQRAAYSHQAAWDWETFLLHRAKELKPGGWLVLAVLVEDPDGRHSASLDMRSDYYVAMEHVWKKYLESGRISTEEFHRASVGLVWRRPEDLRAPFRDPESSVCRAGLQMEKLSLRHFQCSIMAEWRCNVHQDGADLRETTVRKIMEVQKCWSYSIILNGLDPERSDKTELVDAFFQEVQQLLLKTEPFSALCNDTLVAYVTIRKLS